MCCLLDYVLHGPFCCPRWECMFAQLCMSQDWTVDSDYSRIRKLPVNFVPESAQCQSAFQALWSMMADPSISYWSFWSLAGPSSFLLVLLVTGWSFQFLSGPSGHWLVLLVNGWSFQFLIGPSGHWLVFPVSEWSFWSLAGPSCH